MLHLKTDPQRRPHPIGSGEQRRTKADIVVQLEVEQMAKDVGIDEIECIDAYRDDNHQLEITVIRIVEAVDVVGAVTLVSAEVGGSVIVDAVEIFVLVHLHVRIVVMDEISHAGESAVNDGHLPSLMVVNLSATGNDGPPQGHVGRVGTLRLDCIGNGNG